MQTLARISAALMIGAWLGACSEPSSRSASSPAPGVSGGIRDVRLAELPGPGAAVASDLEAGRPVTSIATTSPRRVRSPRTAAAVVEELVAVPAVLPAAETAVELSLTAVPIPDTHTIYLAPTGEMEQATPVNVAPGPRPGGEPHIGHDYGGSRGPSIIIRGGMGGVDDKCDLRPRGFIGIAINRSAPSFGGRGAIARGGIR